MSFDPKTVLDFWFKESSPEDWFQKSDEYDQRIKDRFEKILDEVSTTPNEDLLESAPSALAAVIVLDQFPRNIYRDTEKSFAYDDKAFALSEAAVGKDFDKELSDTERQFLYMPYMHSEKKSVHEKAVELFSSLENQTALEYELKHKKIIDRFGRYPHRNIILGRTSTPEEIDFLENEEDSSF